jgi:hypothetical protein
LKIRKVVEYRSEAGLTLRDVKNEDRSGYVHENKWIATKCTPILTGLLHENAPIER